MQIHLLFPLPPPPFFCIVLRFGSFFQVLGESLHITSEYLTQETKVLSVVSRVEALEAENLKLKKNLIAAMDNLKVER